jgi:predicted enzyme related to lactoylglutathione lyase
MKKVIGLGGLFIKCEDNVLMNAWYSKHLGINLETWGAQFNWSDETHPAPYTAFSFFKSNSKYFDPSTSPFMINFRVENLDYLLECLRADGIELIGEPVTEEYGKFAWILDPEGNKIELWEQAK